MPSAQIIFSRCVRCRLSISTFNKRRLSFATCFLKCKASSWAVDRFSTEPIPLPTYCGVPSLKVQIRLAQGQCSSMKILPVVDDHLMGVLVVVSTAFRSLLEIVTELQRLWLEVSRFFVVFRVIRSGWKVVVIERDDPWWCRNSDVFGVLGLKTRLEYGIVQHDFPGSALRA